MNHHFAPISSDFALAHPCSALWNSGPRGRSVALAASEGPSSSPVITPAPCGSKKWIVYLSICLSVCLSIYLSIYLQQKYVFAYNIYIIYIQYLLDCFTLSESWPFYLGLQKPALWVIQALLSQPPLKMRCPSFEKAQHSTGASWL